MDEDCIRALTERGLCLLMEENIKRIDSLQRQLFEADLLNERFAAEKQRRLDKAEFNRDKRSLGSVSDNNFEKV